MARFLSRPIKSESIFSASARSPLPYGSICRTQVITEALKAGSPLRSLGLRDNPLGMAGARLLLRAVVQGAPPPRKRG